MNSFLTLLLCLAPFQDADEDRMNSWHQFRGPTGNGVAPNGDPPTEWSEDKNIKWKVEIPGKGSATPIIWKDKIFILTAVPTKEVERAERPRGGRGRGRGFGGRPPTHHQAYTVLCLAKETGKVLWKKVATEILPHEGAHSSATFASPSPVTDGKFLYASFGSAGVFCFDFDGKLQWKRDLGDLKIAMTFGEGASPVIHGDSLVHIWDHQGQSFLFSLDAATGKTKWKVERDQGTTWHTPLIVEHDGVTQIVTTGRKRSIGYDLKTGKAIWNCGGLGGNPIACPVTKDGVVYCMTGFRRYSIVAVPLKAKGDITGTDQIVWKNREAAPYVASPVLYDDLLYVTKDRNAIISCLDAKTGEVYFGPERLRGLRTLYASLAGAGGKIYVVGRRGTTIVLKHGKEFEILATNELDEGIDASPVIVGKELFLRGKKHLYCIAVQREY